MPPVFSIALCTFNGQRYLPAQLDSFLAQTRPPDELIVCDDGSTDDTPRLVEGFAARAPFPVRFHRNAVNLGVVQNFGQAIDRCQGDWIFLSDQDDLWMPEKLARFDEAMRGDPERRFWASDCDLVDAQGQGTGHRLWRTGMFPPSLRSRYLECDPFGVQLPANRICGATCALHASLKPLILPIVGNRYCLHDYWITLVAAATVPVGLIDEPLIRYRQHGGQQVGAKPLTLRAQIALARRRNQAYFEAHADFFQALHERLAPLPSLRRPDTLPRLQEKITLCQAQARMRTVNRFHRAGLVLSQACRGRYSRYCHGLKSLAVDLLL